MAKRICAIILLVMMVVVVVCSAVYTGSAGAAEDTALTKIAFIKDVCTAAKVKALIYDNAFYDVTAKDEYSDVAQGALNAGIIDYSMLADKKLDANSPLTHEEAVTMVVRGLRRMGNDLAVGSDLAFEDAGDISPWALSYVEVALSNGVIENAAQFEPKTVLTLQQGKALIDKMSTLYKSLPLKPGSNVMRIQFPTLTPPEGVERPAMLGEDYRLVFNDDFNSDTLDTTKWGYGYSWGATHNHGGYCVNENVVLENGLLRLKGENKKQPGTEGKTGKFGDKQLPIDYTTGAVNTHHKWNFNYGYFEGSFKIPKGKGLWPAFWMLKDGWPPEIDIFEILCSNPRQVLNNYHYGPSWQNTGSFYQKHSDVGCDITEDFHTYGFNWTPSSMSWYLDGKQLGKTYTDKARIAESAGMYMIINLAIDGWDGKPDETTPWPAYFECDWVRVWQANE